MGTKYSSVSISGFNSSPPSDNAADQSASNKVQWQKHLDKIGTPVKNAIESVNAALVTFTNFGSRSITSADSCVAGDHMKTIEIASTVTVTFTVTLADAATMAAGYVVSIRNLSSVAITIGRATGGDTINGVAANFTLDIGDTVEFKVNASANGYYAMHAKSRVVQGVEATPYTTYSSAAVALPLDDSIPQNTEGTEVITASITPRHASNRLVIEAEIAMSGDAADRVLIAALFQDTTANALAVACQTDPAAGTLMTINLRHEMPAGTTSATTFKIRAGATAGTYYFNGNASARLFGGILACRLRVTELWAV